LPGFVAFSPHMRQIIIPKILLNTRNYKGFLDISVWTKLDYPIIQETAQTLRKRYFKLLEKDKQGIQGWNIDVWDDSKNLEM